MPEHEIRMAVRASQILNADIEFTVTSDSTKLGELHLSKGTIDWRPSRTDGTPSIGPRSMRVVHLWT